MALSVITHEVGPSSTTEELWKSVTWGISHERGTVGALVATLVMLYSLAHARERKCRPPGARPWPVVGNVLLLAFGSLLHRSLEKLASKYGGIMYLRLGSRSFVVISTVAAAKEMFRQSNDANFYSRKKRLFIEVMSDKYKTPAHARNYSLLGRGLQALAITVEWAMAELMVNTDVMKQAREELDAVVGCDRLMQEADIPNLPFLEAVVKESFRLHPPTSRASSQLAEVLGYTIPAECSRLLLTDLMPKEVGRRMCPAAT